MKFLEYLVAWHIAHQLNKSLNLKTFEELMNGVVEGKLVLRLSVQEYLRKICMREFRSVYDELISLSARSTQHVANLTQHLRWQLSAGRVSSNLDLDVLQSGIGLNRPDVDWESFFVLAAKPNGQPVPLILKVFEIAWRGNGDRPERWKLIDKLADRGLLLKGAAMELLLYDGRPKEWEVFLAAISEANAVPDFAEVWQQASGETVLASRARRSEIEWKLVRDQIRCLTERDIFAHQPVERLI
jgi:hypothetical protein